MCENKEIDVLINLYNDLSQLANQHTNLWLDEVKFYTTLIIATITIPIALKQIGFGNQLYLIIFSFVGIFFCLSGIYTMFREAYGFQKTLFAMSKIREHLLDVCPNFKNNINRENKNIANQLTSIGIYHVDFEDERNCSLRSHLIHRLTRVTSNNVVFSSIYIVFILFHILLILNLY